MCAISWTARLNASSFACDGFVIPLTLRAYWRAGRLDFVGRSCVRLEVVAACLMFLHDRPAECFRRAAAARASAPAPAPARARRPRPRAVAGRELDLPARAEAPRRQRELDRFEVRVEEQEERVVHDLLAVRGARADLLAVEEDAERLRLGRCQSRCVIRRPSGRNHQTSGQAGLAASSGEERVAPEDRMLAPQRDQPPRELEQLVVGAPPSRTTRSRCPGTTRCCCRPACVRSRRRRAASARPARGTASRGSSAAGARAARSPPRRRSGPRRRGSTSGCRRCRRGCPRRSPRCACRCTRRGRAA